MPNLLLDLDAEGVRHVRPFEAADELAMAQTFSTSQRRTEVKLQMKELERQVLELRSKTEEIFQNPAHPWRLTRYDLLSAALQSPITNATANIPESEAIKWINLAANKTFESTVENNGVPAHATENDQHLLEWLLLRSRALRHHVASGTDKHLTFDDFSAELNSTKSLAEVRRLTNSYLSSIGSQQPKSTFALELRESVVAALEEDPTCIPEALIFISNVTARLNFNKDEADILVPFAFRISTALGELEAAAQWLRHLNASGVSQTMTASVEDLFCAIQNLRGRIHTSEIILKQRIFELLTGYNGPGVQQPSVALTLRSMLEKKSSPEALAAYEVYVQSLGHLGATRLLQTEAQFAHKALTDTPSLQLIFQNAEQNLGSHASGSSPKQPSSPTADWGQRAKLDYESLQVTKPPEDLALFKLSFKDYMASKA